MVAEGFWELMTGIGESREGEESGKGATGCCKGMPGGECTKGYKDHVR